MTLLRSAAIVILLAISAQASTSKKPAVPALRWAEDQKGCTFERGDDGKYRYGLWTDEIGVIVAIDSQELQMTHRRLQPLFGVLITVRYRGTSNTYLNTNSIQLEFVDHQQLVQSSLDPHNLALQLQKGADSLEDEAQRDARKHPEKLAAKQHLIEEYQKQLIEMLDFLNTRSLHSGTLDPATPEASGWIFFSAKNKWIGDWKKQERLVLRIPLPNTMMEFPITLPPSAGELLLRRRPQ